MPPDVLDANAPDRYGGVLVSEMLTKIAARVRREGVVVQSWVGIPLRVSGVLNRLPQSRFAAQKGVRHMVASSLDVAGVFSGLSGGTLSNLALQKFVYLAHMMYAGLRDGERLVQDEFQAWDYGPVAPLLYRQLSGFGASPIPSIMFRHANPIDTVGNRAIREVWEQLNDASPRRLVQITHDERGAWARFYQPGARGIVIPQGAILDEYKRRTAGNN